MPGCFSSPEVYKVMAALLKSDDPTCGMANFGGLREMDNFVRLLYAQILYMLPETFASGSYTWLVML